MPSSRPSHARTGPAACARTVTVRSSTRTQSEPSACSSSAQLNGSKPTAPALSSVAVRKVSDNGPGDAPVRSRSAGSSET